MHKAPIILLKCLDVLVTIHMRLCKYLPCGVFLLVNAMGLLTHAYSLINPPLNVGALERLEIEQKAEDSVEFFCRVSDQILNRTKYVGFKFFSTKSENSVS